MRFNPFYFLSALIVLFNSQIFRKAAANPLGVAGVQEFFYAVLSVWALASVLAQIVDCGRVNRLDLFVLLSVVGLSVYSATLAFFGFGQPIFYGLIEERRLLSLLVYFPISTMLIRRWVTIAKLENLVIAVALLCAAITIAVYIGIIPEISTVQQRESSIRGERYGVGQHFIAIAILYLLARAGASTINFRQGLAGFLFLVLLIIVQTRHILFGLVGSLVIMLTNVRVIATLVVAIILFAVLVSMSPQVNTFLQNYRVILQGGFTVEYFTQSWRAQSIGVAIDSFFGSGFWGNGALLLAWNDGFHRIHGPYFFLADIGFFGSLYRYGVVGLVVYLFYVLIQTRLLLGINRKDKRILYAAFFVMIIVGAPLSAPLEYRGFLTGFVLAVTAFLARGHSSKEMPPNG